MPYSFSAEESVAESFHRTSRELLGPAARALREDAPVNQARAVHAARKAIKKERALLRLTRSATPPRRRRRENAALRAAGRRLSSSRDAAVMIAALDDLSERYAGQVPHATFTALRERLHADRPIFSDLSPEGPEARAAAELEAIAERIGTWQLRRNGFTAADGGLDRTYRRGITALRRVRRQPSDENLHAWRKRAKDLWYALRLLSPVCGEIAAGQAREAHRLVDLLGDDHDLAILRRTLLRTGAQVPADFDAVIGLLDHRRGELQAQAVVAGARVYSEPPEAFRRRIRRLWRAGRDQAREERGRQPAELAEATRP